MNRPGWAVCEQCGQHHPGQECSATKYFVWDVDEASDNARPIYGFGKAHALERWAEALDNLGDYDIAGGAATPDVWIAEADGSRMACRYVVRGEMVASYSARLITKKEEKK